MKKLSETHPLLTLFFGKGAINFLLRDRIEKPLTPNYTGYGAIKEIMDMV